MYILTDSQIFSRSAWPYSVNKHFIMWPLTVKNCKNSVWTHNIRQPCTRAEQLYKSFYNKYLFYFFASNKELTIHWKTQYSFSYLYFPIAIHAKKPTESWHKAVKNMLATEVVLHGAVLLDSTIHSWMFTFMTHFGGNKTVFVINSHWFCRRHF